MRIATFVKARVSSAMAIVLAMGAYGLTGLPGAEVGEKHALATRFGFEKIELPRLKSLMPDAYDRQIRVVHRDFQRIDAWISSVGAAVSIADLDRDGLPNEIVLVDPRIDKVVVQPVPNRKGAFTPFDLNSSLVDHRTCAPMGSVCGDFNEDGLIDVLVYYWERSPLIFLQKEAVGGSLRRECFQEVELDPSRPRWFSNAATSCDLDGDGHVDLVIANYFADGAAILDPTNTEPQYMQESMSRGFNGGMKHFFLWTGGTQLYREIEPRDAHGRSFPRGSILLTGWTLALGAWDLNKDSLPELYLSNDFGPDRLFVNRSVPGSVRLELATGRKSLISPNSRVLGNDSFKGMGVDFADLNADGVPDIVVSNIATEFGLQESHFAFVSDTQEPLFEGSETSYVDKGECLGIARGGWGWDVKFGDFDNDGFPEILRAVNFVRGHINAWPELHEKAMGNDFLLRYPLHWPTFRLGVDISGRDVTPFYVMGRRGTYVDIAKEIGLQLDEIGRGIATGDVDGDGKLDFVIANQWGPSYFLHNSSPIFNQFLQLQVLHSLEKRSDSNLYIGTWDGTTRGRPAIGAEVVVTLPNGRKVSTQIDGGNGHSGRRAPEAYFGLGHLGGEKVSIEVFWRFAGKRRTTGPIRCAPGRYTLVLPDTGVERS